jgi:hypothetical protein
MSHRGGLSVTKIEAYRYLSAQDRGTAFLANVVFCHHTHAAQRLKGMVKLHMAGHELCCAPFSLDRLWIDGHEQPWTVLETGELPTVLADEEPAS